MGVQAFGFEEDLVRGLVGKLDDLVFDGRAVARPDRLNLPAVHGRAVDVFADDAVGLRRGLGDVAGHLDRVRDALGTEAERRRIGVAGLRLKPRPVDGAAVEARRRARLEAAAAQAEFLRASPSKNGGGLAGAARRILLLAPWIRPLRKVPVVMMTACGADGAAVAEADAEDAPVVLVVELCSQYRRVG